MIIVQGRNPFFGIGASGGLLNVEMVDENVDHIVLNERLVLELLPEEAGRLVEDEEGGVFVRSETGNEDDIFAKHFTNGESRIDFHRASD